MNTSKENLLEIKKFNEWKRHHELNEINFRASRPGFAAAAIGRAGARLLGGALGAGRAAVNTIGKTAQVAADANQNVTNVLNRTSPQPRVKGQFIKHSDYASMEGQRVLQTGAAGRSNIKLSAIKALKGAQNAIRAGVRGVKMNTNLSTPSTGTDSSQKSTLGKITSAIANGVVDKMVSTIHTYDPGKTTADNRKHNLNAPLGSHILKRLTK
jgi:hypothetical protein